VIQDGILRPAAIPEDGAEYAHREWSRSANPDFGIVGDFDRLLTEQP